MASKAQQAAEAVEGQVGSTEAQEGAGEAQEAASAVDSLMHGDTMVQEEISAAVELLRQQREVQKQVGENRQTLRLLDKRNKLSEPQGEWLDAFYPEKKRGEQRTPEQIKRTRQVRAEALGVDASEVEAE